MEDVPLSSQVLQELYEKSGAARWGVTAPQFRSRLEAAGAKHPGAQGGDARAVEAFVRTLHLQDLALAIACAAGHEEAWEHFVRELRPALNAAARAVAPGSWQELADSLLGDLFGLEVREGRRRSLLDYYHGRARLSTWLRAVLAQRHVDRLRASARTVALDDTKAVERADPVEAPPPRRQEHVELVQQALDAAIAALDARDRLRLRLYYAEGVKLAAIGRLLGEHEATVSRKLDRVRREIRQGIEGWLREERGLHPDAVRECIEEAGRAPELDLTLLMSADE